VDPVVSTIAARLNASAAQVLLKWVRAKGVVNVTTSSKRQRLAEYLAVEDLPPLTPDEIAAIDAAGAKGPPSSISNTVLHGLVRCPLAIGAIWTNWLASHENVLRGSVRNGFAAILFVLFVVLMYWLGREWF